MAKYSLERFGRGVYELGSGVVNVGEGVATSLAGAAIVGTSVNFYGAQAGINAATGAAMQAGFEGEVPLVGMTAREIHDETRVGLPWDRDDNILLNTGLSFMEHGGRSVVEGAADGAYAGELFLANPLTDQFDPLVTDKDSPDYLKPGPKSQILYGTLAGSPENKPADIAGSLFNPLGKVGTIIQIGNIAIKAEDLLSESGYDLFSIRDEAEYNRLINQAKLEKQGEQLVSESKSTLDSGSGEERAGLRARILLGPDGWSAVGNPSRGTNAIDKFRAGDYAGVDAEWQAWRAAGGSSRLD